MPIAMLVAMTITPTSARAVSEGHTRSTTGPSTIIPTSIATTIST